MAVKVVGGLSTFAGEYPLNMPFSRHQNAIQFSSERVSKQFCGRTLGSEPLTCRFHEQKVMIMLRIELKTLSVRAYAVKDT